MWLFNYLNLLYILSFLHLFSNQYSIFMGNIMFLSMNSECLNTVDCHMIIIIFLIF
jgi:hypothetical protein